MPASPVRPLDDETRPIPVVLPSVQGARPQSAPVQDTAQRPELDGHGAAGTEAAVRAARARLEQIRELYETADAMGGEVLAHHAESASQRQQDLIHDYFRRPDHVSADLLPGASAADPGLDSRPA